ncbi:BON domain-containing protein [Paraburkholderia nemoris]|uniref:BON domain-containing protein n=1 Tax=Paraburkholderia nemoris TaxID=2793076 RepID=UPI001B04EBD4|nr:BON domain-containing protein [Paraburkholderia nemoris]CAE6805262.1 hypothetical protein LMG22931_05598 [Paraburkholderia nemoris]
MKNENCVSRHECIGTVLKIRSRSNVLLSKFAVLCMSAGLLAGSVDAFGQSDTPDAASVGTSQNSQAAPDKKAVRLANRKLRNRVATALGRVKGLDSTRIFIRADSGKITLTGTVPEASQATVAAAVAQSIDGVTSVANLIKINASPFGTQ